MILKVEHKNGWHFYDNVRSLYSRQLDNDQIQEMMKLCGVIEETGDIEEISTAYYFDKECEDQILYASFIHNGGKYELYAGRAVYLLNDSGKTIERLI